MTRTKKIARIPCQLMNKDQAVALKLEEQPYLIIIPKSILQKLGITKDEFSFELVLDEYGIVSLNFQVEKFMEL